MTYQIIYAGTNELNGYQAVGREGEIVEHYRHFGGEPHTSTGERYPTGRFPTPEIESG
jgi:hypothetical protein